MSQTLTKPRSRSTLNDVAELAGVSVTTASLVLTGKAGKRRISESTHARVRQAAKALGYSPSLLHRSMRRGRTHVISFFSSFRHRDAGDQYLDRMSAGLEHAGGALGYDVLVHCNFSRTARETFEFLNGGFADGLVLFNPPPDEPLLPLIKGSNLPTVLIDPWQPREDFPSVVDDKERGMDLVVEALLAQGHTRLGMVAPEPNDPTGRLPRFRSRLEARGIALPEESVVYWDRSPVSVFEQVMAIPSRPTGIFVWHDRAAYDILQVADSRGVSIPKDLSIVGYDGLVWPSTSQHVVTSVRVPMDELTMAAVTVLDHLITGVEAPMLVTIPVSILPGTTLGTPIS